MTSFVSILLAALAPMSCGYPAPPDAATTSASAPGFAGVYAPAAPVQAIDGPGTLEELYRSGLSFDEFLARVDQRKAMWVNHYENGAVSGALIERARRIAGTWRILAVAEDWCSDSANTIPYLALLTEQVDGVDMRLIDDDAGREIMEAHRTPDGRPAIPTLLILDEDYEEVGCWIERPADLQAWALEDRSQLEDDEFQNQKMAWYREDGGKSAVSEVLDVIEAAASGTTVCGG